MKNKILITSALPYANGPLHFGHIAGAYLPGDCYARFQRMQGNDVLYICGSDEYGVAITLSAELAGRTPKEHVDIFHKKIADFFHSMNISFDHYSRTTWEGHNAPSQQFFLDLHKNGFIEERITDQLFSEKDNRFLADRYVVGTCPSCKFDQARGDECQKCGASYDAIDLINPRSKLTNSPLVKKPAKHWFLLLEKFKDRLNAFIESKQWKPNVTNFVKNYIDGLRARAITRDSEWGVPVPLKEAEGKVLYVWFDAPIGYISSSMEWAQKIGKPDEWKKYWLDESTELVHFIGKDNIPFHGVIFPAMVMGQDQPYKLVDQLPANEFYNLEGRRFSKSDGWYIDTEEFLKKYTPDQIRYTIAANAPETSDSEFSWKDFQSRCNADLLGKFGNFVNRTLVFIHKQCDGVVPSAPLSDFDKSFIDRVYTLAGKAADCYREFKLRKASQLMIEIAQEGNAYFDAKKPWAAAKLPESRPDMEATLFCCVQCIKILAVAASPIIPETAQKVWEMLGFESQLADECWQEVTSSSIPEGQKLNNPIILFRKIEDEEIVKEQEALKTSSTKNNQLSFDEFSKMELVVGKVLHAEPIPKSKKLLKLEVDLGGETRQIVSGISHRYSPEEVIGKHVVVVSNLKPAKLMGVESHGMILAGGEGNELQLVSVDNLSPGTIIS